MGRGIVTRLRKLLPDNLIEEKTLAKKRALYKELEENVLPDMLWVAFLLPDNAEELLEYESAIDKCFGKGTVQLKLQALDMVDDEAQWKKAERIRDPYHEKAMTVALALLEVLYLLREKSIPKNYVSQMHDTWTAVIDNFGFWKIRYILEDSSFALLDPKESDLVRSLIDKKTKEHARLFKDIDQIVSHFFEKEGLDSFNLSFRMKNTFGVYQKMQIKNKNINHINDLFGIRIITKTTEDCMKAKEILHRIWPPHLHLQKDYIENPKPNGYQSFHTTLHCLQGESVEFQIRTEEMDRIAKFGPASHSNYKKASRKTAK